MIIIKIRFAEARSFRGVSGSVTDYTPGEARWRGWRAELIGPAVFLIGPDTTPEGAPVYEVARSACSIEYRLNKGERFDIEAVKNAKPAVAPEKKLRR